MSSEKPNFLSQPVVKNIFMFRNGDPYYEARRIVINQKRVSNFETLLREVTGGIQAPFGAVRNIYTPRGGHKVDCLESLQSGEQYVAAGRERFKKLDYLQIGSRRRRLLQTLPVQAKPLPQNRIVVSARFLKPIKEPCTIFVVANGDVLNPALRLLIHQRMLGQFDRILEMITERMGLRVLGGVRSLYTYEGQQVTDGNHLESGQLYVAVGREKFKKLSYSDLLFTKPRGTRRINGMKVNSLPPIYRFSKQNGNCKSTVTSSDSGGGDSKASLQGHSRTNKEHLSSIVREISQARLISLRKKRSGQSMTLTISDNDDHDLKGDDGNTDDKTPQDQPAEPTEEGVKAEEEKDDKMGDQEETAAENTKEEEEVASTSKADEEEKQETNGDKENREENSKRGTPNEEKEAKVTEKNENKQNNENGVTEKREDEEANNDKESEETAGPEEKDEEEIKEVKEVMDENKEEVKSEEQKSSSSTNDKTEDSKEKEDGSHTSSEGEKDEQGKSTDEEKQDKDSEKGEKSSKDQNNDVDTGDETENSNDPGKTQPDNETKGNDNDRSNSSNSNQEEDGRKTKEGATKESGEEEEEENGEVSGEDDEVESEAEPDMKGKKSTELKDTAANGEKGEGSDEENEDNRKKDD